MNEYKTQIDRKIRYDPDMKHVDEMQERDYKMDFTNRPKNFPQAVYTNLNYDNVHTDHKYKKVRSDPYRTIFG